MKTCLVVVLALIATAVSPMQAATRKKASPKPTPAVDLNDRITALHLTSVTVTITATHQSKEFKVTPATKFTVNGKPSTLSGLAVGMDVNVTTSPNDPTTAAAIDAKTAKR
jgi:hypothetical protein